MSEPDLNAPAFPFRGFGGMWVAWCRCSWWGGNHHKRQKDAAAAMSEHMASHRSRMLPNPEFSAFPDSLHHAEHDQAYSCLDAACVLRTEGEA